MAVYDYDPYAGLYDYNPYDDKDDWAEQLVNDERTRFGSALDRTTGTVARGLGSIARDLEFDDTADYLDRYGTTKSIEAERFVPDAGDPRDISEIESIDDALKWANIAFS